MRKKTQSLTFIDLFAGVGGFRLGMERAGHRCVGFCEIDKYARQSYKAIFDTTNEVEMHDITKVSDDTIRGFGHVDIITGGFPCQAFSLAGKRRGFEDVRGTLFFEIARFAHILRPSFIFLENVKGLLNHERGTTFETILRTLDGLGYDVDWQVFNSKDFVAQNRERVFIIGYSRKSSARKFLPLTGEKESTNQESAKINLAGTTNKKNNLNTNIRKRTYYTDGLIGTLTATDYKMPKEIVIGNVNPSGRGMNGQVCSSEGLAPTLTTNKGEGNKVAIPVLSPDKRNIRQQGRRIKNNQEAMFTLTAQDRHGIIVEGKLDGNYRSSVTVYSTEGISPTLNTMQGGGQQPKILVKEATKKGYAIAEAGDSINFAYPKSNKRRGRVGKQSAHTLVTGDQQAVVTNDFQIRKLTPMECWRLQAFPDWAFLAAKFNSKEIARYILENSLNHYQCDFEQKMSDSQLYKQAGNSVTVDVIYYIAKNFQLL
ncbi:MULTISPECIES: DNA (cytosine-5-)-methyltransferase [unclassified Enterococcus]|uniref:DNA (cytosine-5-)-methyltransferase n=1 Tax=unclassified Enterococcus TaxID=2608891 RepID=UPI0013EDD2A9|nr:MULTISPECIES: DNA (cytosine-5-)-methyltransferase [unclassified Enterococcus]